METRSVGFIPVTLDKLNREDRRPRQDQAEHCTEKELIPAGATSPAHFADLVMRKAVNVAQRSTPTGAPWAPRPMRSSVSDAGNS